MSNENSNVLNPPLIPNTAAIDTFTAPDSTAKRPRPETLEDRPRSPNQVPYPLNSPDAII